MKIHHIGIACADIEKMKKIVKKTHTIVHDSGTIFDEHQDVRACLLKTSEGPDIELISGKKVENLVAKGITYYHLGYEVKNMDSEIARLKKAGAILLSAPKPAILFEMAMVAFMYLQYGVIELIEYKK